MTDRTYKTVCLIVIAVWFGGSVDAQIVTSSKDLPNLYKVNAELYRGGQPTEAGVAELKRLGIKTIIDLRDNDGRARNEEVWAKAAGLRFVNIPLSNLFGPADKTVATVVEQINRAENQPVFLHCKRGSDRTGTIVAVYRMTHDGWTGDEAYAEAKKFGFGWWQLFMKDYINDYYRGLKATRAKAAGARASQ